MIKELVLKNRSYRRFDENTLVDMETLHELVELARNCPSAANLQPIKYYLSNSADLNDIIFSTLAWAGYLKDWAGPQQDEQPSAYIIILGDKSIKADFGIDPGIVAQTMLLGAVEKGLGGCMIASVRRQELHQALNLPAELEIVLVIALGKPVETVVLEDLPADGSIRYYRDDQAVHHVPKRSLQDLIVS